MTASIATRVLPYGPGYYSQVVTLLQDCGWRPKTIPDDTLIAPSQAFIAYSFDGSRVVGFIRIITDRKIVSYVAEIAVKEDYRHQGIGSMLMGAAHDAYPEARIDLLSTSSAQPFYEEVGFTAKPGYRRWPR